MNLNNLSNIPSNFLFQDNHPNSNKIRNELVKNLIKRTECNIEDLEELFFSDGNMDIINKQLVLSVWKKSNKKYKIGFQDKKKLIIVMRYIFIEYAKNLPYDLTKQINELNCITVGAIVPDIITNFEQKLGYLRDIETRGELIPLPKSTNNPKTLTQTNMF
jgi:hypothetical protein